MMRIEDEILSRVDAVRRAPRLTLPLSARSLSGTVSASRAHPHAVRATLLLELLRGRMRRRVRQPSAARRIARSSLRSSRLLLSSCARCSLLHACLSVCMCIVSVPSSLHFTRLARPPPLSRDVDVADQRASVGCRIGRLGSVVSVLSSGRAHLAASDRLRDPAAQSRHARPARADIVRGAASAAQAPASERARSERASSSLSAL